MKYVALIFVIFVGALKAEIPAGATDLVPRSDGPAAERLKMKDEPATIVSDSKITIASLDPKISATPKAEQVLLSSESDEVDGLLLRAELVLLNTSSSIPQAVLVFRVTNKSNSPVERVFATLSLGFKLTGVSPEGKPVAYSVDGRNLFDRPMFGSLIGNAIASGEFTEFKLPLDVVPTLFAAPIQSVSVSWSKGRYSTGGKFRDDSVPRLTVKLDIKSITNQLNEISVTPKAGQVLLSSESAEVDGFIIRAELTLLETSSKTPEVAIVFRATNVSKGLVYVNYATQARGFKLTGTSFEGKPVAYSSIGKGLFNEPFEGSYRGGDLRPGEFEEFKLPADVFPNLFIAPIQSCSVGWSKGLDGKGEILPVIPGLTIKLDQKIITKLLDEIRHR